MRKDRRRNVGAEPPLVHPDSADSRVTMAGLRYEADLIGRGGAGMSDEKIEGVPVLAEEQQERPYAGCEIRDRPWRRHSLHLCEQAVHLVTDQTFKNAIFILEMREEGSLGHARARDDIIDAQPGIANLQDRSARASKQIGARFKGTLLRTSGHWLIIEINMTTVYLAVDWQCNELNK